MTAARDAGFTLLETLVALVVLGFLMAGLAQGTRFGFQAWDMQARMIDERSELDGVDRVLRSLVEQMDAGTLSGGPTLAGSANRLIFTSRLPQISGLTTRRADVILAVDAARRLSVRWTPHRHAVRLGPPPEIREAELLRGVAKLEISYWRQEGGGAWLSGWSARELPALIRFRIVFSRGDSRQWPDIVVAPMNGRRG